MSGFRLASGVWLPYPAVVDAKAPKVIKGIFHGGRSTIIPDTDDVAMTIASGKMGKVAFQAMMSKRRTDEKGRTAGRILDLRLRRTRHDPGPRIIQPTAPEALSNRICSVTT